MLEIWRATLQARGLRPVPLATAGSIMLMAAAMFWTDPRMHMGLLQPFSFIFALVIAAGMIGSDVETGSTQLLLSRAVSRNGYLAGRFLGVLTLGSLFLIVLFGVSIAMIGAKWGVDRNDELLLFACNAGFRLVWLWSAVFFFSCLLPSYGDVVGYFGQMAVAGGMSILASEAKSPWVSLIAGSVAENLTNPLVLTELSWRAVPIADLSRWTSNVALALLLGAVIFNRREFSYASG